MIHLLKESAGRLVPWKNGGGVTNELLRIDNPQNPTDFVFRISIAQVLNDGPFSNFPFINRTLLLLSGKGMVLKFYDQQKVLSQLLTPIEFKGEESIYCSLIDDACVDFNIMIDRRWGKCTIEINTYTLEMAQKIVSSEDIYLYQDKNQNLFIIRCQPFTAKS